MSYFWSSYDHTFVNFFAMLYVLYLLTKEPFGHDQRWHAYSQNAQSAAQQLGMNVMTPSWKTLKERSYLLYILLTILTLGFSRHILGVRPCDRHERALPSAVAVRGPVDGGAHVNLKKD